MADPPDAVPLTAGQLDALDRGVEAARRQLEVAESSEPISGVGDELDSRILITHDGTVVASDADPSPGEGYTWSSSLDRSVVIGHHQHGAEHLRDRRGPRRRAVPAGEYSVYVSFAEAGGRAVAGPWSLSLLAMPPAPTGFPEGFPVDDVPLIGGRLVSATPMDGSSGEGWGVEIAVDGDDAATEAVRLLGDDRVDQLGASAPARHYLLRGGVEVGVAASTSADGEGTSSTRSPS